MSHIITSQEILRVEAQLGDIEDGVASLRASVAMSERRNTTPEAIAIADRRTFLRLHLARSHLAASLAAVDALLAKAER